MIETKIAKAKNGCFQLIELFIRMRKSFLCLCRSFVLFNQRTNWRKILRMGLRKLGHFCLCRSLQRILRRQLQLVEMISFLPTTIIAPARYLSIPKTFRPRKWRNLEFYGHNMEKFSVLDIAVRKKWIIINFKWSIRICGKGLKLLEGYKDGFNPCLKKLQF